VAEKVGSSVFGVLVMIGFEWQMNGGAGLFAGWLCPCINAICLLMECDTVLLLVFFGLACILQDLTLPGAPTGQMDPAVSTPEMVIASLSDLLLVVFFPSPVHFSRVPLFLFLFLFFFC
jgi:hypothetical protein